MPYLYLILSVIGIASASIFGGFYNRKNADRKDFVPLYSLIQLTSIFIFYTILFVIDGTFSWEVLPYSLGFAIGFSLTMICNIYALKTGPVVLTSLILQLSLIGVTAWGFIFWGAKFSWLIGVGLVLIVLSLWLCLYTKKQEENKINLRWIFWVVLMFLGNSAATIIQKTQQMQFNGQYGSFLMFVATGLSAIFALLVYLRSNKKDSRLILKTSWYYPALSGVLNAIMNFCVILLATSTLSPSLIYPVLAIGSLAVTTVFSAFVFKEKLHWWQWCGVAVGAVAVALLSI